MKKIYRPYNQRIDFTESKSDNPLEEDYVYYNNKFKTFTGQDSISSKDLVDSFDLIKEETKDVENRLLNLSNDYFQQEFGFFNIFKINRDGVKGIPFGRFINKLWLIIHNQHLII